MTMTEKELYKEEQKYWNNQNINFFGLECLDESWPFEKIEKHLDKCCEKYWNVESPCKLARYLNNGILDHDANQKVKHSYRLELNVYSLCTDIYAKYLVSGVEKEFKVAAIPTPSVELAWIINNSYYTPRVTSVKDFSTLVGKISYHEINGEFWKYDFETDKFTCLLKKNKFDVDIENIFNNHLSNRSKALLQSCIDEPLTVNTFKDAMSKLPIFENNSIFNYKFSRLEYFEDIILNSGKYAQPTKKYILGVNQQLVTTAKQYTSTAEKFEGCLVRSESPIFALENFRTVVNIYDGKFKPAFSYQDTAGFFDAFKTTTSGSAGRQRLLLDNVVVKDGMLWVRESKNKEINMFETRLEPQKTRLSCLSSAPFCNNDKPKRIMMNAKLSSQAVPLKDEETPLTHRIKARIGFTDLEGYTYGDSIIISESFAKRLETFSSDILYYSNNSKLYNFIMDKIKDENYIFTPEDLKLIYPTTNIAILDGYKDFKINKIEEISPNRSRFFVSWSIPFRLGDKITNLHGAKGTVGKILPDDEMPKLTKKAGNMEPGPLEVIISGFSVIRRGSLGQIFEAWALANDIKLDNNSDFIATMSNKYADNMKEFSKASVVSYKGKKITIPLGLNYIMRLYHHATIHISESNLQTDYNKMIKFGEMEKLNLISSNCINILKELSIRSIHRYFGGIKMAKIMEEERELPQNPQLSIKFAMILKSMGLDLKVNNKSIVDTDLSELDTNYDNLDLRHIKLD